MDRIELRLSANAHHTKKPLTSRLWGTFSQRAKGYAIEWASESFVPAVELVVRRECTGFAVEAQGGDTVGDFGVGDYAAADAGEQSDTVLGEVDEHVALSGGFGAGQTGGGHSGVGDAGVPEEGAEAEGMRGHYR